MAAPQSQTPKPQRLDKAGLEALRDQISQDLPRVTGRIRKLKQEKGFGFIAGDDGVDYFFHWTTVQKGSARDFRTFEMRDRVSFAPISPKKDEYRAIEVLYIAE